MSAISSKKKTFIYREKKIVEKQKKISLKSPEHFQAHVTQGQAINLLTSILSLKKKKKFEKTFIGDLLQRENLH
jgi:hypothetical protein